MILRVIYTFFIGVLMAAFAGVGISAFYSSPKHPDQPAIIKYCSPEIARGDASFAEFKSETEKFDKKMMLFETKLQTYNRNVSIIALCASILILIASLTLLKKIFLISDGLLLGGALTLLYSIARGFGTEDNMFRFIVISVGLVISLFLGYVKFIIRDKTKKAGR